VYKASGELPLGVARLAFLLDDVPLAARLLTRFCKKSYTASYLDESRRRFRGSKQGTLSGEATVIAAADGRRAYFGYGRSQIGLWRVGGQSLARLAFEARPAPAAGLRYSLEVVAAPDGAIINRVMSLGLFRKIVQKEIRAVVEDIDSATTQLSRQGLSATDEKGGWSDEERARLAKFLSLP
jgi:hypothetical protein